MNDSAAGRLARTWAGSIGKLTLLRLSILWLAVGSIGFGLTAMVKYLQPGTMFWTGFFGASMGWLLGRSRLSGWRSALFAAGAGILWLFIFVGRLYKPLGALLSIFSILIIQINLHKTSFASLDSGPLLTAWNEVAAASAVLFSRIGNWYRGISAGNVVVDPIVTTLLWATMIWIVAIWAGWLVRRKGSAFIGLLPGSTLLAYNAFYTNSKGSLFWLILLGGTLVTLQAANGYLSAQRRWEAAHMHRANLEHALTATVIGITLFLMLLGGVSPSISVTEIKNTIARLAESRQDQLLAKSLSLESTPGSGNGKSNVAVGMPNLPAQHRIGPGPVVLHDVVMYATIQGYEAAPPAVLQEMPEQISSTYYQYWRGQTYETYTGSGWTTRTASEADYPANTPLLELTDPLPENYQIIHQHIQRVIDEGGALFVIGDLVSANQPYHASWRSSGDLINAQTAAAAYDAESLTPDVTVDQLRSAGTDYPDAIRNRYLQLPSSLPQRVRSLALDLTALQLTPYDQAVAIEAYLRTFTYDLDVPAPPVTRDVADYFLFDLKKGYCDYFATTMAVMARAAGIPSRLVIGYASGQFNHQSGQFIVTLADSHAWVEIYFPGYGWVQFEPTAGLPPIERSDSKQSPDALTSSVPITETQGETSNTISNAAWKPHFLFIPVIVLAAILIILLLPIERWILLARPAKVAVTTIYRRLYRQGYHWGIEADASRTPHEFATTLVSRLQKPSQNVRLTSAILAPLRTDLDWLTNLYTRMLYSPLPPTHEEHLEAVHTWKRLRQRLLRLHRQR